MPASLKFMPGTLFSTEYKYFISRQPTGSPSRPFKPRPHGMSFSDDERVPVLVVSCLSDTMYVIKEHMIGWVAITDPSWDITFRLEENEHADR
jgi:hypothetical protein